MKDNAGEMCMLNNSLEPSLKFEDFEIRREGVVYDVVRIIDKVPLFLEDHFERMSSSFRMLGLDLYFTQEQMMEQIKQLISANRQDNCNVKTVVFKDAGGWNCLLYISSSYYPGRDEVERGVHTSLLHLEREKPNVKLVDRHSREAALRKMKERGAFEVLLVNREGKLTEGSKSNLFFVKGSTVYTAPDEYVLKGITRKHVLEACRRADVPIVRALADVNSLDEFDGVFISGTSINVLPVSSIDSLKYNSGRNPVIAGIREQYEKLVREYVEKRRS